MCEKVHVWNPRTCASKIDKYLKSIIYNSVVIWDEIVEVKKTIATKPFPTKTITTNFNKKKR